MQINNAFMWIYIHLDEHNYFSVILACRYKLKSNNGSFTSSRTPSLIYPDFQYCSWLVTVHETLLISLIFTSIRVPNCKENFIDIYDGRDETFPLLARYCGSNATVGNKLKSTGNNLYLGHAPWISPWVRVRVMIRVSFLSRPIPESIPECAEYILVTLRNAVLKFTTLSVLE